jgi:hypothetical protein
LNAQKRLVKQRVADPLAELWPQYGFWQEMNPQGSGSESTGHCMGSGRKLNPQGSGSRGREKQVGFGVLLRNNWKLHGFLQEMNPQDSGYESAPGV